MSAALLAILSFCSSTISQDDWHSARITSVGALPDGVYPSVPLASQIDPYHKGGIRVAIGNSGGITLEPTSDGESALDPFAPVTVQQSTNHPSGKGSSAPLILEIHFSRERGLWVASGFPVSKILVNRKETLIVDRNGDGSFSTDGKDAYWNSIAEEWFPLYDSIQLHPRLFEIATQSGVVNWRRYSGDLGNISFLKGRPASVTNFRIILESPTAGWVAISKQYAKIRAVPGEYRIVRGSASNRKDSAVITSLRQDQAGESRVRVDRTIVVTTGETTTVNAWKLELVFATSTNGRDALVETKQFRIRRIPQPAFYQGPEGVFVRNSLGWSIGGFSTGIFEDKRASRMTKYSVTAEIRKGRARVAFDDGFI